ncbi:MAG: hypothetical protein KJ070_01080, partial [Verrucomicrobia bacterium]|nr:hypothetical protein [Verrucomicrobiota bacterium]
MINPQRRLWLILPVTAIAPHLFAATFTVTTTNISGPGSLPAVIAQANATSGSNVIQFGVTNIIRLGLALPTITNDLTILGRTDVPTVISGGGSFSLFNFAAGTTNRLSRLVLADGSTAGSGAAILNSSTLYVDNCVMTNHRALGGSGGAILNGWIMTVVSSSISDSKAASGGAIYNGATITLVDSQIVNSEAGIGGAIYNAGLLEASSCTVSNGMATNGFGGGVFSSGVLIANGSTFVQNRANGRAGHFGANGQNNSPVGA